jgi:hypothetical protein
MLNSKNTPLLITNNENYPPITPLQLHISQYYNIFNEI